VFGLSRGIISEAGQIRTGKAKHPYLIPSHDLPDKSFETLDYFT